MSRYFRPFRFFVSFDSLCSFAQLRGQKYHFKVARRSLDWKRHRNRIKIGIHGVPSLLGDSSGQHPATVLRLPSSRSALRDTVVPIQIRLTPPLRDEATRASPSFGLR